MLYVLYSHYPNVKLQAQKEFLEGTELHKAKVARRLSFENIIAHIKHEIGVEIEDATSLEASTSLTILNLMQIIYLSNIVKLGILADSMDEERLVLHLNDLITGKKRDNLTQEEKDEEIVEDYIDSLNQFTKDFKLMHCLDLLQVNNFL